MDQATDDTGILSPTVELVIDRFVEALRADKNFPAYAIDRLSALVRTGTPKPDELAAALFNPVGVDAP